MSAQKQATATKKRMFRSIQMRVNDFIHTDANPVSIQQALSNQ